MEYTCSDYRTEMILLALKRRLEQDGLSEEEKEDILKKIAKFEVIMGLD